MADDLGGRLLAATLISRAQLAEAASMRLPIAPALVAAGLDETTLESFLRGEGFEPEPELALAPQSLAQLPGPVAQRLWALPLRMEEEGLVVAMADPSDAHARRELALISGSLVVPRVARVSSLRVALDQAYPNDVLQDYEDDEPDITFELTRPRTPGSGIDRDAAPPAAPEDVVLLVKPKSEAHAPIDLLPKPQVAEEPVTRKRFSRPPGVNAPRVSTLSSAPPSAPGDDSVEVDVESPADPELIVDSFVNSRLSAPDTAAAWGSGSARRQAGASIEIDLTDSWEDLDAPPLERELPSVPPLTPSSPRTPRRSYTRAPVRAPGDIGTTLAQMRTLRDRDAVLGMACEGTLLVARTAVFLALRGQVLRGWSGRGGSLTADAVRNLWIPISTPSMFRGVVQDGTTYAGPYGVSAADNLFRAATGSRGGVVVICPVDVMGKTVAVLVADDVRYGDDGRERVETLAQAVGDALKRIILARKG